MPNKMKSYEYYFQRFLLGVSYTKNIDYGDPKAVRRNNNGVNMYRKAAVAIAENYPDRIGEFSELIKNDDQDIRTACAISLLTLMNARPVHKEAALLVIRNLASSGTSLEKTAWTMWLEKWGYKNTEGRSMSSY